MKSQNLNSLVCLLAISVGLFACSLKPETQTKAPSNQVNQGAQGKTLSKPVFKNVTVEVACYKKKNPKASQQEAAQALLKIAASQGIDTTNPKDFAISYMNSMSVYVKDVNFLAEIGKEAEARGCQ